VLCVTALERRLKSIPPLPEKVNEEVVSWAWVGNRKINEQVFPESEEGMSKLKIVEIVEDTSPKKDVPAAAFGFEESIGTMRCGNS